MNKKSLFIMLAILIVPIIIYYTVNSRSTENSSVNAAVACNKPTVIDFSSTMCMECKALAKNLDPLIPQYQDKINFQKVIVNSGSALNDSLMKKYNVNVVPTLVFLDKNGKIVRRTEGSMPQSQLKEYLDKLANG
jgi:thioredoxin-like negative regulator of GroEL